MKPTPHPNSTPHAAPSKADKLWAKATIAARVRAYQTNPHVGALWTERIRTWSAALIWAGVVLGLAFTMTNVQQFAANGAPTGTLDWYSAWLLDPMVSLVLIGILVAEQVWTTPGSLEAVSSVKDDRCGSSEQVPG